MSTSHIETQRFAPDTADDWDRLVRTMNNGTLFHTRKFLSYHPADRFVDHSLIFNKKEKPLALFPAAERIIDDKNGSYHTPDRPMAPLWFLKIFRLPMPWDWYQR